MLETTRIYTPEGATMPSVFGIANAIEAQNSALLLKPSNSSSTMKLDPRLSAERIRCCFEKEIMSRRERRPTIEYDARLAWRVFASKRGFLVIYEKCDQESCTFCARSASYICMPSCSQSLSIDGKPTSVAG